MQVLALQQLVDVQVRGALTSQGGTGRVCCLLPARPCALACGQQAAPPGMHGSHSSAAQACVRATPQPVQPLPPSLLPAACPQMEAEGWGQEALHKLTKTLGLTPSTTTKSVAHIQQVRILVSVLPTSAMCSVA